MSDINKHFFLNIPMLSIESTGCVTTNCTKKEIAEKTLILIVYLLCLSLIPLGKAWMNIFYLRSWYKRKEVWFLTIGWNLVVKHRSKFQTVEKASENQSNVFANKSWQLLPINKKEADYNLEENIISRNHTNFTYSYSFSQYLCRNLFSQCHLVDVLSILLLENEHMFKTWARR